MRAIEKSENYSPPQQTQISGFDLAALPAEFREAMVEPCERAFSGGEIARTEELLTLALFADSDDEILGSQFFPRPDGYDNRSWNELKSRLMVLVNLLKASVRTLRTHVYGGKVSRRILKNPYQPDLEKYINGWHPSLMREWFNNCATFSNAAAVPLVTKVARDRYKMRTWLLNPVYTYLVANPDDPRECWGVAEFSKDGKRCQFMTRWGFGVLHQGDRARMLQPGEAPGGVRSHFTKADFGFLPAVVAHAERRSSSSVYSEAPFRNAPKFTVRASDTLFNGALLQKMQTKGLLVLTGLKETDPVEMERALREGHMFLDAEGKAQWIVPESRITDTLELLDRLIEVYSVASAIPVDELNPTSSKGTSAEEAARRSAPLRNMAAEYAETAELNEKDLVLRASALRHWAQNGGQSVDLDLFSDEVETEVRISSRMRPRESQSEHQILREAWEMGAITAEDMAEAYNPGAGPDKLAEVITSLQERREAATEVAPAAQLNQEAVPDEQGPEAL